MQVRFFRDGKPIEYYKSSAIWGGVYVAFLKLLFDITWNIGKNSKISFSNENWIGSGPFIDIFPIPREFWYTRNISFGDFVQDGKLVLPPSLKGLLNSNGVSITE